MAIQISIVRNSVFGFMYLCVSIKLELEPLRGGRVGAIMPRAWRSGNGESLNGWPLNDLEARLRRRVGAGGRAGGSFFTVAYLDIGSTIG